MPKYYDTLTSPPIFKIFGADACKLKQGGGVKINFYCVLKRKPLYSTQLYPNRRTYYAKKRKKD